MQQRIGQTTAGSVADTVALDWETLGRLVRTRTLEAVAMHFAAVAADARERQARRHVGSAGTDPPVSPLAKGGKKEDVRAG